MQEIIYSFWDCVTVTFTVLMEDNDSFKSSAIYVMQKLINRSTAL